MITNVTSGGARNMAEGSRDLNRELESRKRDEKRKAALTTDRLSQGTDVMTVDIGSGGVHAVTSGGESAFPAWTADGLEILYATNGPTGVEFCTIKPDGSGRKTVLAGQKGVDPSSVRLSANGKYVFFVKAVQADAGMAKAMTGETPADLHVAKVGSSEAKRLDNKHLFKQRYAVSPDGGRIVYEVLEDVHLIKGAGKSELWLMRH
jgi:Tol biopolymer transport system component